jgi:ABC-type uncharacterized transport system permease subunit
MNKDMYCLAAAAIAACVHTGLGVYFAIVGLQLGWGHGVWITRKADQDLTWPVWLVVTVCAIIAVVSAGYVIGVIRVWKKHRDALSAYRTRS